MPIVNPPIQPTPLDPDDAPETYFCAECHQSTKLIEIDVGIGSYEYFGFVGNDVRIIFVSECCEADYYKAASPNEPVPYAHPLSE